MIGCLVIHGFTGNPYEVEPLTTFLQDKTTWKIVIPTLPGHEKGGSLHGVKFTEWIGAAELELTKLMQECDKVYLIGFSMGGLICGILAAKYPVHKLVLLSAAYYYIAPKQQFIEAQKLFNDFRKRVHKENLFYKRLKSKRNRISPSVIREFQKLVHSHRSVYSNIHVPTLIAHGMVDGVVPVRSSKRIYQSLATENKSILWIDEANHLICRCKSRNVLCQQVLHFLEKTS